MTSLKLNRAAICAIAILMFGVAAHGQSPTPEPSPQASPQTSASPSGAVATIKKIVRDVKTRERNFPERSTRTAIGLGSKYTSAVFRGMKQGAGFGGGLELSTADVIPAVEFRATAEVSTKLYRMFEGEAYMPRLGDEQTHADVTFNYTRRTRDNFFGIGPRVSRDNETNYSLEERSLNAGVFRDFTHRTQAGVYVRLSNSHAFRGEDDSEPPVDLLFSGNPASVPASRFLPGLDTHAKIFSAGAYGVYDRRDNSRGLTQGAYLYGRFASNDGRKINNTFSDFDWFEGELDGRAYVPLGSDKTSAAARAYVWLKNPKGGSQIPFYDMAFLGGRTYVRGFDEYRYFGNNLLMFTTELRQTVWSKTDTRGIDVFAFGDAGQVWGDNRSQTDLTVLHNDKFSASNWRASFGGGAQYRVGSLLILRAEVAHSSESNKFYFSIGRGF
ncbi:MAG: BamA/TamA family outer membrane protein [Pyrinomonadaceae bacterium]